MVRNLVRSLSTLLLVASLSLAAHGIGNAVAGMNPGFIGGEAGAEMDPNG